MKLWYLRARKRSDSQFCCIREAVVRAKTEASARNKLRDHDCDDSWCDEDFASCEEITGDGKPGVVLVVWRE